MSSKHVHITFGDSASGLLKYMWTQHMHHEFYGTVINMNHDLSIGPLNVSSEERELWFERIRQINEFMPDKDQLYRYPSLDEVKEIILNISEKTTVVLWYGSSVIEQLAVRLISSLLKSHDLYHVRIPCQTSIGENSIRTLRATGECNPEQLWGFFETCLEKLSPALVELWKDQWDTFVSSEETLRIYNEKLIVSVEASYYDALILAEASGPWRYVVRVIGQVLGKTDQVISDAFIEFRVRYLIEKGYLKYRGSLKTMRDYEVRIIS